MSTVLVSRTAATTGGGAPTTVTAQSGTTSVRTVWCRASTADAPLTARKRPSRSGRPRRAAAVGAGVVEGCVVGGFVVWAGVVEGCAVGAGAVGGQAGSRNSSAADTR